jgi:hypothetical protein
MTSVRQGLKCEGSRGTKLPSSLVGWSGSAHRSQGSMLTPCPRQRGPLDDPCSWDTWYRSRRGRSGMGRRRSVTIGIRDPGGPRRRPPGSRRCLANIGARPGSRGRWEHRHRQSKLALYLELSLPMIRYSVVTEGKQEYWEHDNNRTTSTIELGNKAGMEPRRQYTKS